MPGPAPSRRRRRRSSGGGRPRASGTGAPPLSTRGWLRHLARHVPVAIVGDDPEGVHQVRVAAGRVAVWLEMSGRSVLLDDLRELRRAAAAVRDCDVLLLAGAQEPFASRLRERRESARTGMAARLRGPHVRALRQALALLPPLDRKGAEDALPRFFERVLRRGDALVAAVRPDDEQFHRVRRAVRKLRYALEWLGRDTREVKAMQQAFGDLNDLAVEAALLRETGSAADLPRRARTLALVLASKRRRALAVWRTTRAAVAAGVTP